MKGPCEQDELLGIFHKVIDFLARTDAAGLDALNQVDVVRAAYGCHSACYLRIRGVWGSCSIDRNDAVKLLSLALCCFSAR